MPRVVLENQTVRPDDLPSDASESYFRQCRFVGTFTNRLRAVDFVNCVIDGDLSGADLLGYDSWNTTWNTLLPDSRMDGKHDLVIAMLRRRADAAAGRERALLLATIAYLDDNLHGGDWPDGMYHLRSIGFNPSEIVPTLRSAFAGRNTFQAWIDKYGVDREWKAVRSRRPDIECKVTVDGKSHYLTMEEFSPDMIQQAQRRDRWALARATENYMALINGGTWRCRWKTILPADGEVVRG